MTLSKKQWGKAKEVKKVSVEDLFELIGTQVFEDIVEELHADKWVIHFKTMTVFKLIVYNLLESERHSLRVMSESYSSPIFQAMLGDQKGTMSYTAIRSRLMNVKQEFFKRAYEHTSQVLEANYSEKALKQYHIKRYDSTMIATFSHLLCGMKVGNTSKGKTQVKLTTELAGSFEVRMTFFKDQAHLSEETALAEVIEKATYSKKDLIVFDRGLKDRLKFVKFDSKSLFFVTRLADKPRFVVINQHSDVSKIEDDNLIFIQDSIVHLFGNANKKIEHPFRLIEMQRKSDKQTIFLLTNCTLTEPQKDQQGDDMIFLTTQQVAEVYKSRWDIEVLFKFLKQEMNLKHFVCNDTNAIQVMIYCTLIVAMLLLVYKKLNNIRSYKIAKIRFFNELQAAIMLEMLENTENIPLVKEILKKYVRYRDEEPPPKIKNKIF
jgi:Transposase DDE domain